MIKIPNAEIEGAAVLQSVFVNIKTNRPYSLGPEIDEAWAASALYGVTQHGRAGLFTQRGVQSYLPNCDEIPVSLKVQTVDGATERWELLVGANGTPLFQILPPSVVELISTGLSNR